jgi:hypothetical protein
MRQVVRRVVRRATAVALLAATGVVCLGAQTRGTAPPQRPSGPWPIKTREHVDLWLHGYALASVDTAPVPLFRRGYRDSLIVVRNVAQQASRLDTALAGLARTLATTPRLLNGQFYPLHFTNYATLRISIQLLTRAKGDPRAVGDRDLAQLAALAANYFATPPEREFAEELSVSLESESLRFHHQNWLETQRTRAAVLARADSLWRADWFAKLAPFLRGTQQRTGEIIVSPVVEGEGRTISVDPATGVSMVVTLPPSLDRTSEVLYGIVHEAVGTLAAAAVTENITPRQRAQGLADRLQTPAAIRAGLLLLQRAIPAEAEGYARFYLRVIGRPVPPAGAIAALEAITALPPEMIDTIKAQLDLLLSGL